MQRMQTPMWRRGLRGLRNVRVLIYLVVGAWFAVSMILRGMHAEPQNTHDLWSGVGLLLLVVAVPFFLAWRAQSGVSRSLAAQRAGVLSLEGAGVTTTEASGASVFAPWSEFTAFREGQHAILLLRQGRAAALVIPAEGMDAAMRGSLRSMLLSNLPERL